MTGEHRKRHARRTHKQEAVCGGLNPLSLGTMSASAYFKNSFSLKFNLFNQLPGTHYIDLNISTLKWCSLINCNWCVSLDIA